MTSDLPQHKDNRWQGAEESRRCAEVGGTVASILPPSSGSKNKPRKERERKQVASRIYKMELIRLGARRWK
jgi:hypothetical protein